MSNSSQHDPNAESPGSPGGKTVIPEPRVVPNEDGESSEGLRIGVGSGSNAGGPAASDVVRLQAEEPVIARAEQKVSYADLVHDQKRRVRNKGEIQEWGVAKEPVSFWWIVVTIVFVFGAIIGAIYYAGDLVDSEKIAANLGMPELMIEPRGGTTREERIADLLDREDEARELYLRFLRAGSLKELLGMARIQPSVHYLANRYRRSPELPDGWKLPSDCRWDVFSNTTPIYGRLSGYFPDESPFQAFMTVEHDKLYVDWKASVRYSTATMEQLNAGEGDGSEIRVWVKPAVYYSPDFPESEYLSYFLYARLEDPPVWGYARRGSDAGNRMREFFKKSRITDERVKPKMLLLSLAKEDKGLDNQWVITSLLHSEWITP